MICSSSTRVAVLIGALLLVAGCNQVRNPQVARGGAPGLGAEGSSRRMTHNAADPNAPFSVPVSGPRLAKREHLLDVNGVPPCTLAQLSLFESRAQSNGARHTLRFSIGNNGEVCRLAGFPSISLLRADGSVLGDVRIRKISSDSMTASLATPLLASADLSSNLPSPQVLLPTHGDAAFDLGWTTGPDCEQVSRIAITAPGADSGNMRSVVIPRQLVVCEDQILITAVAGADPDQ